MTTILTIPAITAALWSLGFVVVFLPLFIIYDLKREKKEREDIERHQREMLCIRLDELLPLPDFDEHEKTIS